jgi:glycerophosphoryl diester phosphodiesterase
MKRALIAAALLLTACNETTTIGGPIAVVGDHRMAPADLPAFFDCLRERGGTIVSAHRGGPDADAPENSIAALAGTSYLSPAFLEIDIAQTRDGVLVLMHDETLERTTTGEGRVDEIGLVELQSLWLEDERGVRTSERVPTLDEALGWAERRAVLELDVKRGVAYEDVVHDVRSLGAMGQVVFITYSVDGAARLAQLAPEAMIYTTITNERDLDTLERRGVDLTHIVAWLGDEELDAGLVRALAERGVEARFGIFGRDDRFAEMAEAGVQSLAVDDVGAAYRAADAADGEEGYAALQCAAAE